MRSLAYIVVALATACDSTTYVVSQGRVSTLATGGVVPGARTYPDDWGDGLVRAVAANPAARDRAEIYRRRTHVGLTLALTSLGCLAADAALAAAGAHRADDMGALPRNELAWALGVGLACSIAGLVGAGVTLSAPRYAGDAITIFNMYPVDAQLDPRLPGLRAPGQ